jgi:sugar lactone lactonase YvrE
MRSRLSIAAILAVAFAAAGLASASAGSGSSTTQTAAFPKIIPLPNGWFGEGIATGRGTSFYVSSIPGSAIYAGDLRTGAGRVLVPPDEDRLALGLKVDHRNRIFVAGALTGQAYVYDADTGETLATFTFGPPETTEVNDVIVTKDAAYFTDPLNPRLYVVPIARNGALGTPYELPLSGDYVHDPEGVPEGFNLNGIAATPSGRTLIVDHFGAGKLYRVDPMTGVAREIDLDTGVPSADGLLLRGKRLYVVQAFLNQVSIVELESDLGSGQVTGTITDPALDVPTTIAGFGRRLYVVNAKFNTEPGPDVPYEVVQLPHVENDDGSAE